MLMKTPPLHQPPPVPPAARRNGQPKGHRGFSMIEVLVVILLFSFGLLGLVQLQARATQGSVSSEDNNRAALLASELATVMWASNTVDLPATVVAAWNTRVANTVGLGLPNGTGEVDITANVARITVSWRPSHASATDTRRYVTEVLIP
jgi:type IV pilus assembly protein PilV